MLVRGFTIIEMMIAFIMLMTLSFLITSLIISGNDAHKYSDRLGRVTEISQEVVDEMRRELLATVRLFGDDTIGNAYKSTLEPWSAATRIASSTLPTIKPLGTFDKDVLGKEKTGNEILFARHAWADTFTCTSGKSYRVDVYRLVAYFMRLESGGPNPSNPWGLDLCKWTSEPLVNGTQIDGIAVATDQAEMLIHLRDGTPDDTGESHAPCQVVWMLGADPSTSGTFRQILATGAMTQTPQLPRADPWQIQRADDYSNAGMLFYRHHSVASNYAQSNQGVARYGLADNAAGSGVGFPHGLEIQIIGSAAARQVLIHLTTVSLNQKGMKAYYDIQAILGVREG